MPEQPSARPRIIAITNQKGGVGKTTTAINLGAGLANSGRRVLLVDIDPQGNASTGLGLYPRERNLTSYELLMDGVPVQDAMHSTKVDRLSIVPSSADLSSADLVLGSSRRRSFLLRRALQRPEMDQTGLDFILIDCPPSLGLLTVNGLVAADSVLVPLQSEFYALEGLSQLLLTVREIRGVANPDLRIEGVVMTMSDRRNRLSREVEADARENLGELVFQTVIPRNVRLSEAPSHAVPVLEYDPDSKGSRAYRALASELMTRHQRSIQRASHG